MALPQQPANQSVTTRHDAPTPSFGNKGSLDAVFNPRTVAVVSTSELTETVRQNTLSMLTNSEFAGQTFVVQPGQSTMLGKPAYPNLGAVPAKIDLAVVVTAPEAAPDILAECVEKGVKGVVLISSGFGASRESAESVLRMHAILEGSRTRLIGPNTLGVMNPRIGLNATPGLQMPIGGSVAFLGESATLSRSVLNWSLKHIVGFSCFASVGTMMDVSWADLIDFFGRDPNTRTILIQIGSIGDARPFLSAAREVSLEKPIIAIKVGRSDASIGALGGQSRCVASNDDVLQAALHRVGVVQVDTIEDLFYTADAVSKQPRPKGPRLMVVSNTDGPGVLAADSVVQCGGQLAQPSAETCEQLGQLLTPEKPLDDVMGDGSADSYAKAVEISAKDPSCDGLLLVTVPGVLSDPQGTAERLVLLSNASVKPMLISYIAQAEMPAGEDTVARSCLPIFSSPAAAARVFNYMWRYSYDLRALYETPSLDIDVAEDAPRQVAQKLLNAVRQTGRTSLTEAESNQILAIYGVPTADSGVGLIQEKSLYRAKLECRVDAQFGPVLLFGSAGYGSIAIGLPPLNATLARRMLEQSALYAVLRNECGTSMPALEGLLVRFSQLVAEQPWIKKLEIDPLLISREHLLALDACCEVHGPAVSERELIRPAIRPYPVQYISSWTMKNGRSVTIRPVRSEDEPLMVKFHETLTDRTVYQRFFQRLKLSTRTAHERLSRACFLDYDREIALLAEYRDPETKDRKIVAIATLLKLPDRGKAEVAVMISDDHQGLGLGKELIAQLVDVARNEGVQRLIATTMLSNESMCAIFKRLGFQLSTDFEEHLVSAELVLEDSRHLRDKQLFKAA